MAKMKTYTCHPIKNFKVGKFQFENGSLMLKSEDEIAEFEKTLTTLRPATRHQIKEISPQAAAQVAAEVLGAHQGPATSESLRAAAQIAKDQDEQLRQQAAAQQAEQQQEQQPAADQTNPAAGAGDEDPANGKLNLG